MRPSGLERRSSCAGDQRLDDGGGSTRLRRGVARGGPALEGALVAGHNVGFPTGPSSRPAFDAPGLRCRTSTTTGSTPRALAAAGDGRAAVDVARSAGEASARGPTRTVRSPMHGASSPQVARRLVERMRAGGRHHRTPADERQICDAPRLAAGADVEVVRGASTTGATTRARPTPRCWIACATAPRSWCVVVASRPVGVAASTSAIRFAKRPGRQHQRVRAIASSSSTTARSPSRRTSTCRSSSTRRRGANEARASPKAVATCDEVRSLRRARHRGDGGELREAKRLASRLASFGRCEYERRALSEKGAGFERELVQRFREASCRTRPSGAPPVPHPARDARRRLPRCSGPRPNAAAAERPGCAAPGCRTRPARTNPIAIIRDDRAEPFVALSPTTSSSSPSGGAEGQPKSASAKATSSGCGRDALSERHRHMPRRAAPAARHRGARRRGLRARHARRRRRAPARVARGAHRGRSSREHRRAALRFKVPPARRVQADAGCASGAVSSATRCRATSWTNSSSPRSSRRSPRCRSWTACRCDCVSAPSGRCSRSSAKEREQRHPGIDVEAPEDPTRLHRPAARTDEELYQTSRPHPARHPGGLDERARRGRGHGPVPRTSARVRRASRTRRRRGPRASYQRLKRQRSRDAAPEIAAHHHVPDPASIGF